MGVIGGGGGGGGGGVGVGGHIHGGRHHPRHRHPLRPHHRLANQILQVFVTSFSSAHAYNEFRSFTCSLCGGGVHQEEISVPHRHRQSAHHGRLASFVHQPRDAHSQNVWFCESSALNIKPQLFVKQSFLGPVIKFRNDR